MLADRYELHGLLRKGGMAEVFEATARGAHGFARRVAIKRLLPQASGDPTMLRMFLDEARTASRLHHAGIIAVLDFAVFEDSPFQVLELVDGWDASQLLREAKARGQSMPLDVALCLATEVAHALAYAHEATDERGVPLGIVHRDVKPSNILVSRGGHVKLGDFGIALARERVSKTTGFIARGTPAYMSPEQLMGSGFVDTRTDVFALGCTLHALVTGWSPLSGEGGRAAMMAGARLPIASDLPPSLAAIVERALSVAADARFASAREMAAALGAELASLLRTDPKSRTMQWLETLALPPRAPPAGAPVTVIEVAPPGAVTTMGASTLASTDRIFTAARTSAGAGQSGLPMTIDATAGMGGPRYSVPHAVSYSPPHTVSYPAPHTPPAPQAPPAPLAPKRDNRMIIFAVAVLVPLAIALIAGAGIFIGHRMTASDGPDAAGVTATTDAAGAAAQASPPSADAGSAAAGKTAAGIKPGARPAVVPGSPPGAAPAPAAAAEGLPGTTAPVANGCRCDGVLPGRGVTTGLCHPLTLTPTTCACETLTGGVMCWRKFRGRTRFDCPEMERPMPATTRGGEACTAFPIHGEAPNGDASFDINAQVADVEERGQIGFCRRCGENRIYPRSDGARCVGISPETGDRIEGKIVCR